MFYKKQGGFRWYMGSQNIQVHLKISRLKKSTEHYLLTASCVQDLLFSECAAVMEFSLGKATGSVMSPSLQCLCEC